MPKLKAGETPRRSLNTKVRDELREQLEKAAEASGHSLSREIERRLEESLRPSLQVPDHSRVLLSTAARVIEMAEGMSGASLNDPGARLTRLMARRALDELLNVVLGPDDGGSDGGLSARRSDGTPITNFSLSRSFAWTSLINEGVFEMADDGNLVPTDKARLFAISDSDPGESVVRPGTRVSVSISPDDERG